MQRLLQPLLAGIFICVGLAALLPVQAEERMGPRSSPIYDASLLTVSRDLGDLSFSVELADTLEKRALGLMFRTELPERTGMLFIFDQPEKASFWMRNTLIPLDMIFIKANGQIANIIHEAEPETDTQRRSKGRVIAVLELAGGEAARLGLEAGQLVRHPALNR